MNEPIRAYRDSDSWPICPRCWRENSLYSLLMWSGRGSADGHVGQPPLQSYIEAGLRCTNCDWEQEAAPRFRPESQLKDITYGKTTD